MCSYSRNKAPIGIFDSGVGGLSVLRALKAKLPGESFIYIADSGNAPYGKKSPDFIEQRTEAIAAFLVQNRAKAIVVACNTASILTAKHLRARYTLPIVAMEPAIKPATKTTQSKAVLVLATTNTIRSDSVASLCERFGAGVKILLQECPGLVEQVEHGKFGDTETRRLLKAYIQPGLDVGVDTIVLGCTHYAFLSDEISRIAGSSVTVIEPSEAVARQVIRVLPNPTPGHANDAPTVFYTSGSVPKMQSFLSVIGEATEHVYALPSSEG